MINYTKKILKEYKSKADLYGEFGNAVSSLLQKMLKQGEYKHYINSRVKDAKSLEKKIEEKKLKGKIYRKLEDVKDVVGIRIIFYSNSDRAKFIQKMQREFGDSLKVKETFKMFGYRATHAIVSLDEKRLKLSEYATFKNLECEVQLSLILEHAWAEIEHDILYKENCRFKELDKTNYLFIKQRMEEIMKNYINRASIELEYVMLKFRKIKRSNRKFVTSLK